MSINFSGLQLYHKFYILVQKEFSSCVDNKKHVVHIVYRKSTLKDSICKKGLFGFSPTLNFGKCIKPVYLIA